MFGIGKSTRNYISVLLVWKLIWLILAWSGFKNEIKGLAENEVFPEFGVVQDADRLDAIGAIGNNKEILSSILLTLPIYNPSSNWILVLEIEKYWKFNDALWCLPI